MQTFADSHRIKSQLLRKKPNLSVRELTVGVKGVTGSQKLYSSIVSSLTIGLMLTAAPVFGEPFFIDADLVCRWQRVPPDTECLKLNHALFGIRSPIGSRLSLLLAWDPGQVSKPTWNDSYEVLGQRLPPRKTWFSHYALRYRASETIEVSLEDWAAATLIPDASGLSYAYALQDSGWKQTALRLSYVNPDSLVNTFSLITGLGEGERFKERDHKPYLALMARREIIPALEWQAAWSYDADSQEADHFYWMNDGDRQAASEGYKTERQSIALVLNSFHPMARGLRVSLGLQRNLVRGPKTQAQAPVPTREEGPFDLSEILADKRTLAFSASYLILAEYLLGFHWQKLTADPGSAMPVKALNSDEAYNQLRLTEQTFGLGHMRENGWSLFLESFNIKYDRLYELYHFAPSPNQRQRALAFVQLRAGWTW